MSALIQLRDRVERTYVINFLVGNATIVLKDIVVGGTSRVDNLLENRLRAKSTYDYQEKRVL